MGVVGCGMAVTSMLIAALNNVPDCYSDVPVVGRLNRGSVAEKGFQLSLITPFEIGVYALF
jgi:hypothetical protein